MQAKSAPARRTRSFTEHARRTQIIAATIDVIAEVGFAKATYARIAERAGLSSTGLISYHFEDKAELVEAVLLEIGQTASSGIAEHVAVEVTALGRLGARITAQLEWITTYPAQVRALYEISMNARGDDGALQHGEGLTAAVNVHGLVPILKDGQDRGELREFDLVLVALAIKSTVDAAIYRLSIEPTLSATECANQILDLFARALRAER